MTAQDGQEVGSVLEGAAHSSNGLGLQTNQHRRDQGVIPSGLVGFFGNVEDFELDGMLFEVADRGFQVLVRLE